jgi:SagB-type dehydrogenase family enzyme
MTVAHDYLKAILQRGRDGMPPYDFQPNWQDAPRAFKFYRDPDIIELPRGRPQADPGDGSLRAAFCPAPAGDGAFTVGRLADMLRESYGLLGRRLEIHANDDVDKVRSYVAPKLYRGVASGGGRYPVSIYWSAGPGAGLTPGLYYYNVTHHGLQRLLAGNVSDRISAALAAAGHPAAETDQFLILGLKFWQNSFKYNNFCYHAVTMDIGTLLQSWRQWTNAHGLTLSPALWFDERDLGDLLGVPPEEEGIVGVVPLRWADRDDTAPDGTVANSVVVRHLDEERSREVLRFDFLEAIHRDTLSGATSRPSAAALDSARAVKRDSARPVPLPPPDFGRGLLSDAVRARRSSFGRFEAEPLPAGQLSTVLAAAVRGGALPCDIPAAGEYGLDLVKMCLFVNHVAGIEPGAYEYDRDENALLPLQVGPPGEFLQRNYFLNNYNVERAGAVLVPVVRAGAVLDAIGPRGYRLINTLVGSVAQAVYVACAGVGIGCGAALGFDNISYAEEMGLGERGEVPLLMIMIGRERGTRAAYRYEIA